jgi:hypothetical protein
MSAFIGRNFFLRSILSNSDQKSFDDLEKDIKDCMQVWRCGATAHSLTCSALTHLRPPHTSSQEITSSFVFEQMTSPAKAVPLPDSGKLRKELCRQV